MLQGGSAQIHEHLARVFLDVVVLIEIPQLVGPVLITVTQTGGDRGSRDRKRIAAPRPPDRVQPALAVIPLPHIEPSDSQFSTDPRSPVIPTTVFRESWGCMLMVPPTAMENPGVEEFM